jgi:hypothetical protein
MSSLLSNPSIVIMLAVAALCLGFLIGFFLKGFLNRGSQDKSEESSSERKPPNRNFDEVAHLWQDRRDGRLIFQVDNEFFKRSSDLTKKEKNILLKIVMDFYQWLEPTSKIKPANPEQTPTPEDASTPEPTIELPPPSLMNNTAMVASDPQPSEQKRPSFSPVSMIKQALESDVSLSAIPAESIVVQIDAILQEKLNEAEMQKWAVRLVEFPNRGMVVMVGLEQYDEIDAIPYERVRKMIREAVTEWEQRSERNPSE